MVARKNTIQNVSELHRSIMEWLICNPTESQGKCAKIYKVSESWLSRIINSDLFQAEYRELCAERRLATVHSLGAKMTEVADRALDLTLERLAAAPSDTFLLETTGSMLDRLGYGGKGETHQHVHNEKHVHLDAASINGARERARVKHAQEAG